MADKDTKYNNLLDKISKLEAEISSLERSKRGKKAKAKDKDKDKDKDKEIRQKLCVFSNCPSGSTQKDKLLFGNISFGDGSTLCSFSQCPPGSSKIGSIGKGAATKLLCGFDKCPKGGSELANYVITKKKK